MLKTDGKMEDRSHKIVCFILYPFVDSVQILEVQKVFFFFFYFTQEKHCNEKEKKMKYNIAFLQNAISV